MAVRITSVRECILYEYAKLIADRAVEGRAGVAASAREGKGYWSFFALTFKKLADGRLQPSSVLRENKQLIEQADRCAYSGAAGVKLQWEHILPRSRGGSDTVDNLVLACAPCNLAKGARQPLEWYALCGLDRKEIPRLLMRWVGVRSCLLPVCRSPSPHQPVASFKMSPVQPARSHHGRHL